MSATKQKINFNGKKVLVTGAGRGIGRAVAVELHAQGATVFALSKNADNLKSLKAECPKILPICVDLANWDETRKALENNVDNVDAVINNAAICEAVQFLDVEPDHFDRLFNINLKSVINVSQIMAKKMIAKGNGGAIVNVSSTASRKPYPNIAVYGCTKAAMNMLTRNMAIELGPHKITVNSICPAMVDTDMCRGVLPDPSGQPEAGKFDNQGLVKMVEATTPTRTAFMPMAEVVDTIVFFASGLTTQITGETIAVDGGFLCT